MAGKIVLSKLAENNKRTKCEDCPLRTLKHYRAFTPSELDYISAFKTGELAVDKGSTLLVEGSNSAHLFTVLSGWGFRYKLLEDGRRQILNYCLPGDLVGLQGTIMGEMEHSVEALTDVLLCVFEREKIMDLFKSYPELGFDLTWIASREESILDEHLLSVGRRTAFERAAYLLCFLEYKTKVLTHKSQSQTILPITQQHVADTLGLSIVHTNKTLKKLGKRGLIKWQDRGCLVNDADGLSQIAGWQPMGEKPRPFL